MRNTLATEIAREAARSYPLKTKERPLLFSDAMVQATMKDRKTQTRRLRNLESINRTPDGWAFEGMKKLVTNDQQVGLVAIFRDLTNTFPGPAAITCPYGQPGDGLWIREAWALSGAMANAKPREFHDPKGVLGENLLFRADGDGYHEAVQHWRPSIHMPRWASRINLEVTVIRVERLKDITQEDAKAEGLAGITKDGKLVKYGIPDRDGLPGTDNTGWPWSDWDANPRMAFRTLWAKIHGIAAWDANPWVWVVEFRRLGT